MKIQPTVKLAEIAWSDGLLLGTELFQWGERRIDQRMHEALGAGVVGPWGVVSLQAWWDGTSVGASSCEAVMPSGARISCPDQDDVLPLRVEEDRVGDRGIVVSLAAPTRDELGSWNDPEGWTTTSRSCRHANGDRMDQFQVPVIRRRLRLVHSDECPPGWESIPLLRLRRADPLRPDLTLDETFIPPLLCMGGSLEAARLIRALATSLRDSATSIASDLGESRIASLGLEGSTALALQKLAALNRGLGALEPLVDRPEVHPFEVWRTLTILNADLSVFSSARVAPPPTRYRHEALAEHLRGLVDSIDSIVRGGIRRPFEPIPLVSDDGQTWTVEKPRWWQAAARVVVGIRHGDDGPDAARRALTSAKLFGSNDHSVLRQALTGLRLEPRERDLTGLPPGHIFADLAVASSEQARVESLRRSPGVVLRFSESRPSSCPVVFIERTE
jgi:type VI secretion system protein ImpJ